MEQPQEEDGVIVKEKTKKNSLHLLKRMTATEVDAAQSALSEIGK